MEHTDQKTVGADILRGIAILMVFIYHTLGAFYVNFVPWNGWFRDFMAPRFQPMFWLYPVTFGWGGVALFFVLSGFCIHLSFLRSSQFGIPRFLWRRFWRIYPAYVVALVVFTICNHRHINLLSPAGAWQMVSHLLFLHDLSNNTFFGINGSFWSIATEIQLYLLFPLLLVIRKHLGIVKCLVISFAFGIIWRPIAVFWCGLPDHLITPALTSPLMTWFDWTLGAFVAERFFEGNLAFVRRGLWLSVLLPVFIASTLYKPATIFGFTLAAAVAAVVLDAALQVRWKNSIGVRIFTFTGMISYSLYLWHQPLLYPVVHFLNRMTASPVAAFVLVLPVMIAGSWFSFRFIEQVGIRVGNSFWERIKPTKTPVN